MYSVLVHWGYVCPTFWCPAGSPGDGPRFDRTGTFIPHSVLGPSEDYTSTLRSKGMVGGSMSTVWYIVPGY